MIRFYAIWILNLTVQLIHLFGICTSTESSVGESCRPPWQCSELLPGPRPARSRVGLWRMASGVHGHGNDVSVCGGSSGLRSALRVRSVDTHKAFSVVPRRASVGIQLGLLVALMSEPSWLLVELLSVLLLDGVLVMGTISSNIHSASLGRYSDSCPAFIFSLELWEGWGRDLRSLCGSHPSTVSAEQGWEAQPDSSTFLLETTVASHCISQSPCCPALQLQWDIYCLCNGKWCSNGSLPYRKTVFSWIDRLYVVGKLLDKIRSLWNVPTLDLKLELSKALLPL